MNRSVFPFHFYSMFKRTMPQYGNWRSMVFEGLCLLVVAVTAALNTHHLKLHQFGVTEILPTLGYWLWFAVVGPIAWAVVIGAVYASFMVFRFHGYETIQMAPGYRAFKLTPQEREFKRYCARNIEKGYERIIAVANLDSEGNLWAVMKPGRHHHVLWFMSDYDKNDDSQQQGFLTNKFRFLGREDARKLAMKNGQAPEPDHHKRLFSEDLWSTPPHLRQQG